MKPKKQQIGNPDQNTNHSIEESAGNFPTTTIPRNATFEHPENDPNVYKGSKNLIESYNINDKAHADSSKKDFIKTVSNFNHANESDTDNNQ